jgi:hypothetical protein
MSVQGSMNAFSPAQRLLSVVVCFVLLALGLGYYVSRGPAADVVKDTASQPDWKAITYEGVRIDIPAGWERLDLSACEFESERWGPSGAGGCDYHGGVTFYRSSLFDPVYGPGVRRGGSNREPLWAGYAYAGEFAVYCSDDDRDVVAEVLRSAEQSP